MKNVPLGVWITFILIAGTGWGLWIHDKLEKPAVEHIASVVQSPYRNNPSTPNNPNFPNRPPAIAGMPDRNLWMQYSAMRQKMLQENPELAAEYKELTSEISAQRDKLNAAMIQADPKVAPIIAKLDALRKGTAMASPVPRPPIQPPANLPK